MPTHHRESGACIKVLVAATLCLPALGAAGAWADWWQVDKLTAADAEAEDIFGHSVAISGNIAVIGAYAEDERATSAGAAYVIDVGTGRQIYKLTAADGANGDHFGGCVDISGNIAVVGAAGDEDMGIDAGNAFLFDVTTGEQLHKLYAHDGAPYDNYGCSVAIDGNVAIVGASLADEAGPDSGAAYLNDVATGWQYMELTTADIWGDCWFGCSVDISGNIAIVGANGHDQPGMTNSGAAFLFDSATGEQLHMLIPDDPAALDYFGSSVAIKGNIAIVGAPEKSGSTYRGGAAYLFDVTTGEQLHKLIATDAQANDFLGCSVALGQDIAILGAKEHSPVDEAEGAAYIFDLATGAQLQKLTASDAYRWDHFGTSVDIDGNDAVIGAHWDDDHGSDSGSAYLFAVPPIEPCSITTWGDSTYGQSDVPGENLHFVAVAAGRLHSLGLKPDGSIAAWGRNDEGQCNVPEPNSESTAVASGQYHSLGLKRDGSIAAWGWNEYWGGYAGQCDVPDPNEDFIGVAGGYAHSLGIKSDGSIVAWGLNESGQCEVPYPNTDFVAVAGGYSHSLGLKSDGSIVAWGHNGHGQRVVPAPNEDFVAVAAGWYYSMGLKADGTVVAWGENDDGQCDVPLPNEDFVAIAAGGHHGLALRSDGSVAAWGRDAHGQCVVPEPNRRFVSLAAGEAHSLGLKDRWMVSLRQERYVDAEVVAGPLHDHEHIDAPDLGPFAAWVRAEIPPDWLWGYATQGSEILTDRITVDYRADASGPFSDGYPDPWRSTGYSYARVMFELTERSAAYLTGTMYVDTALDGYGFLRVQLLDQGGYRLLDYEIYEPQNIEIAHEIELEPGSYTLITSAWAWCATYMARARGEGHITLAFDSPDCNENGIPDDDDIADCDGSPWCSDCNENGVLDKCDIAAGTSEDLDGNGIPDECERCAADLDASGAVDFDDLLAVLAAWGPCEGDCPEDIDDSGAIDFGDLLAVLAAWGSCE